MFQKDAALSMFRLSMLIVVYALLVFSTYGNIVLFADKEYQHIEHIPRSGIVTSSAYTITNEGNEPAIYTLGFYIHTSDHVRFPYRLVYQDESQVLQVGESIVVYPGQMVTKYPQLPDTMVVNGTGSLTVNRNSGLITASASTVDWLPNNAKSFANAIIH